MLSCTDHSGRGFRRLSTLNTKSHRGLLMFFHWLSDDIKFHHNVADHHRPSADSAEPAEREHEQTSLFLFPWSFLEKKMKQEHFSLSRQSWFDYCFKASSRLHFLWRDSGFKKKHLNIYNLFSVLASKWKFVLNAQTSNPQPNDPRVPRVRCEPLDCSFTVKPPN